MVMYQHLLLIVVLELVLMVVILVIVVSVAAMVVLMLVCGGRGFGAGSRPGTVVGRHCFGGDPMQTEASAAAAPL